MNRTRFVIVMTVLACLLVSAGTARAETLNQTFAAFAAYAPGTSRKVVKAVERAVYDATGDPESKAAMASRLVAVLRSDSATPEAKCLACLYAPLVCDASAVEAITPLLKNPKTSGPARGALQRLACPAADAALRDALKTAAGTARVGLINSIGIRRDAAATASLRALLTDKDPAVAAAAAAALGSIGSADAAAALSDGKLKPTLALLDALLECAARRAEAGDAKSAATIYRGLTAKGRPDRWRWAGLSGLARCSPDEALPQLLALLDDKDSPLAAPALSLIAAMPGAKATAAMTARLDTISPPGRARLLGALAQRGDRAAAPAVATWLASDEATVQVAAIEAIGLLGDAAHLAALAKIAASGADPARAAAREGLVRLGGKTTDAALVAGLGKGPASIRVELMAAAVARRADGIVPALLTSATDAEPTVRAAAYAGLMRLGGQAQFGKLVALLAAASDADRTGLSAVLASVARRADDKPAAVKPVLAALKSARGETAAALLGVLQALGGDEALGVVTARLASSEASVREAALRCLIGWAEPAACEPLLAVVRDSADKRHRILAMRGYLRLAPASADPAGAFAKIRMLIKTAASKRLLLSALGEAAPSTASLDMALSMLDDADVKAEAPYAVAAIATRIAPTSPKQALAAVAKVREGTPDKDLEAKLAAIERLARRRPRRGGSGRASYNAAAVEARKKHLASAGPKGGRMLAYLDCGPAGQASGGGATIKLLSGAPFVWSGSGGTPAGTIAFDATEVAFAVSGLTTSKQYALGFSWWDYDHNDRAASVWASAGSGKATQLLKPTRLPSFSAGGKKAAEIVVAIPKALSSKGQLRLSFRRAGGANVVVGEVWLMEVPAGMVVKTAVTPTAAPKPRRKTAKPQAVPATKLPMVMPVPTDAAKTNVLIVTGVDYKGHKWQLTTPVLKGLLAKDTRFEVRVVADPHQLASQTLHKYDVVVMHFKDYEKPGAWVAVRPNFMKFVAGGGGVVLVHFACGAWQGWDEFVKIAGRVWNPKMRGHDPRGPFTVEIVRKDHPITKGMKDFKTDDELYTCLDGKTPIEVLAHSRSKVDKKLYPMAFVLQYGKGRVFHCPLGHDVKAFEAPSVGELFRRGTAWAARLPVTAPK